MVSPEHLNDRMALHSVTEHRSVEERLAACEMALAAHGDRLDGLDAALAAHAEEPIEIVEVEDSPEAEVEVTEDENGTQTDVAEEERGETE